MGGGAVETAIDTSPLVVTRPLVAEDGARRWQGHKAAQIAFGATALFAAQLYLSPAQWWPDLDPLHLAFVLSVVGIGAILVRRVLVNPPRWIGSRTAILAGSAGMAVLPPTRSVYHHSTRPRQTNAVH